MNRANIINSGHEIEPAFQSTTDCINTSPEYDISVIVPVFEQRELLQEALASIHRQTVSNYEVIVIDDASETDFRPIIGEHDNARLVSHEKNRGAAAARNTGIDEAKADFVAFLDADDIWMPEKLERQLTVFKQENADVGLVYTGLIRYELDGYEWNQYPGERGDIYEKELERDRVHPTSTVMVRRDVLEEVGGFDTDLPSRQDYDLWIRITEYYNVDFVNELLVGKREQPDSISKDFESRIEGDLAVFEKVKERANGFDLFTRSRIYSYHHHVIGRDYESNGDRLKALIHLGLAIMHYPIRPISWAMFVIAMFGIDRNGRLLNSAKVLIR
jgi:glycosyltransferase involved in cell wall biosynthesis